MLRVLSSRLFGAGLIALLLVAAVPAQAQDDPDYPTIDFGANLMQSAQLLQAGDDATDPADAEAEFGFHRVRFGLNVNAQFHDRISATVLLEEEPNDFGQDFGPSVDYVALDLALSESTVLRLGTPVTGLINFRGFSDGPAVQGNPLIGNSPADMITAATGVKIAGSYDVFSFDATLNSPTFFETFAPGTGVNFIAKASVQPSDQFGVGAGFGVATSDSPLVFATGDGENYRFPSAGTGGIRNTHARLPDQTIFQADAMANVSALEANLWGGYADGASDSYTAATGLSDPSGYFAGLGLKLNLSPTVYLATRGTIVDNTSDAVDELDETQLGRIQAGIGINFLERARFKIEGVRQWEGNNSFGQIGDDWAGVLAELSVAF